MTVNHALVGKKLKAAREKRGLSQAILSELVELSPGYISYIECGARSMSLKTFILLANALQVSADELLADNLTVTIRVSNRSFAALLADCSEYEARILLDTATVLKTSLRKYRGYLRQGW